MTVVATLKDGRVIARAPIAQVIGAEAGNIAALATLSDLRQVEYVLQYNFTTSDDTNACPHDGKITGNVVGVTVCIGAATTVSGEVIAIGF